MRPAVILLVALCLPGCRSSEGTAPMTGGAERSARAWDVRPTIPPPGEGRLLDGASVVLSPGYEPDLRWAYETITTIDMSAAVAGMTSSVVDRGTCRVTAAEGGIPTRIHVDHDPSTAVHTSGGAALGAPYRPSYSGKTSVLSVAADGTLQVDSPSATGLDRKTLEVNAVELLDPPPYLPDQPRSLSVGDTWDRDDPQWRLSHPDSTITCRCRLVAVREVDGRRIAELSVSTTSRQPDGSGMTLSGTILHDVETGLRLSGDYTGTVRTADGAEHPMRMIRRARILSR